MGEENAKEAIPKKNWVDDLERTVKESKVSAIRSALSFRQNYQDNVPRAISVFKSYEDAFFHSVEEKLTIAREHPVSAAGVVAIAGLILFRGPRRFLFRQTIGRFQSEETKFLKAEKNIKEFNISVDLLKKESGKLLERSSLAERDMKRGHDELMDAGTQLQRLAKTVYKTENQALDLMEVLREIPGREAIRLRAEVASMVQNLKRQRTDLNKRITKISEHGVPV